MLLFAAANVNAELPTFPGAEGFGDVSMGGQGGKVIKVTNLKTEGEGSLQAAYEAEGRLTIWRENGTTSPG